MKADVHTIWFPKAGSSHEEYEDGFAPHGGEFDERRLAVAVTDGATEGMLSGKWARVLAETFEQALGKPRVVPHARAVVAEARQRWLSCIDEYREERETAQRPLRWYEEEKLHEGSFATLVALQLSSGDPGLYRAYAVGDACLFHLRSGRHISSFPVDRADQFGTSPDLVRSTGVPPNLRVASGQVLDDDCFYLCTDAVAHWIIGALENGFVNPFEEIDRLDTLDDERRAAWLQELRDRHLMRNDDVTVMRVTVFSSR